ncbi:Yip1 family protein [Phenylobacterium sp.]|jgi:hypothetical protein|uniref:Yip1 family protein n=1 Tax=Phenylobacterium sp. TaxID=1871053 RepID=UPI002E305598|nr:Yip1 family protein [Phenylobacterium sp.]HEX2558711.1 Yip1 family protein [Phenylobacterium sp.]
MSVVEPGSTQSKLIQRVKDILLRPGPTWDVIDTEPASLGSIYKGYVLILAAIPPICLVLGHLIFGGLNFGVISVRFSFTAILFEAVSTYLLSLAGVFVLALIVDLLAPQFGGQRNRVKAFKVAAYSYTAVWVAGVLLLIPMLAAVALLASLYGLYLLYLGLPRLMRSSPEKSAPYIAVSILAAVVIAIIMASISSEIRSLGVRDADDVQIRIGDESVTVNRRDAKAAADKLAEQLAAAAGGEGVEAADPEAFKSHLPATIAGFERTELTTGRRSVAGIEGSSATATYVRGDTRMTLNLIDAGALSALAALGGAFNMESSSEENGKHERIGEVDGRLTIEEYDSNSRHGSYGVMVGERFMVLAEGDGVTVDELKAAVASVDAGRLEQLASAE